MNEPNAPAPTPNLASLQRAAQSSTLKMFLIGALCLLLMIPAIWINSLVSERKSYRDTAAQEVQNMWGGPQVIGTPLLVVPYPTTCHSVGTETICESYARFYPDQLSMNGDFPSSERARGIYKIPLFRGSLGMDFQFSEPDWEHLGIDSTTLLWERASIVLYVGDSRGLKSAPTITSGDDKIVLNNESMPGKPWSNSMIARLHNAQGFVQGHRKMHLDMQLNGSESFLFSPLAREATVTMKSDWASPSFSGMFLPEQRNISASGFEASWRIMSLNHNQPMAWTNYGEDPTPETVTVGFRQITPVDSYSMTERAIKYVILFISLTFILCFFAERLTGTQIHPLQYLLIGISLLLFYTLLLSLSEWVGFTASYVISTLAISLQIAFFVRMILRRFRAVWITVGLLNALYGFLFVLLRLEDMSLLAGSVGLFVILGALMYISVKFNKTEECKTVS